MNFLSRWPARLGIGLIAGLGIAAVDNYAFEGEVSPIVIVALLLAATVTAGAMWGRRAWVTAAIIWACIPSAHLIKHILGLPDTLQPNTYTSILYLAIFTFVIAALGAAGGMLLHRLAVRSDGPAPANK